MKSEELRYFTGSEILTLAEEFQMQKRWHQDQDKCTFIILDKSIFTQTKNEIEAMIGDTNLFFNESDQPNIAEVEIMIADVTYRRRKRGWEAIILMLLYGINKLNITKYIAKIKFDNEKSINMFEKLKFQKVIQKLKSSAQKRPLLFNSVIYGSFYTGAEFAQQTYSKIFKVYDCHDQNFAEKLETLLEISRNQSKINGEETDTSKTEKPLFVWIKKFDQMLGLLNENDWTQSRSYNWPQLKRYAIYGCFIAGPVLHGWYKWLDMFYKGKTVKIVVTKLLVDQFILTPPLITLFFISLYLIFLCITYMYIYNTAIYFVTIFVNVLGMSLMEGKSNAFDECKAKFLQTFKTSCMYWLPVQFLNFLLVPPVLRVTFVSIAAFCWANILCYLKSTPVSTCCDNQIKY
ncbi:hypothetical protein E2986_11231 [Frieseomelitta varia]|uniref:N-acetyltransferase domain-containing protein n=1 Tax=Frieseomelitta varia TaxID=561572 RepID=A0A833RMM5_9HYME|nr:hypothetical protein E2986_11231 [Frieseomelitta varia]